MTKLSGLLALGTLVAIASLPAQARPGHGHKPRVAAPAPSRQAAVDSFASRMSRLDALMGTPRITGTRSASAEH